MKRDPARKRSRSSSRSRRPPSRTTRPSRPDGHGVKLEPPPPSEIFTLSEDETFAIGETLGRSLRGGETLLLSGDLGAGKTVFARGVAAGLGINPRDVASPTFILVDKHEGRLTLFHADLYRLENETDMLELGLEEFASSGAVVVVEWGERLPAAAREEAIEVRIRDLGDNTRSILVGKPPADPRES